MPAGGLGTGQRVVLYLVMFGAGVGSLVLEVLWIRQLALVLGANTYSVSTVFAAYMAGLALGSLLLGRWTQWECRMASVECRPARLAAALAGLTVGIGGVGLLVTLLIPALGGVAAPLLRSVGWNSGFAVLVRGSLGFVVLLVPTVMIGGMLPVAAQLAVEDAGCVGRRVAQLYSVNTFGSVAGALLAGFLLIEHFGVIGTALSVVVLCGALGVAAWYVLKRTGRRTSMGAGPKAAPSRTVHYPSRAIGVLTIGFGLSGFAALGYEVVWSRALVTFLGQPVYGVTVVLASFLFGLALGGIAAGRLSDRVRDPIMAFGIIEILISLGALLAVFLLARAPAVLGWAAGRWGEAGFWSLTGFAFAVLFVPAFWMGTTFPVANRAYVPDLRNLGARIGRLGAANTVGALLGSLAAGFVLIPLLGTVGTTVLLAGIGVIVGVAALLVARVGRGLRIAAASAGVVVFALGVVFLVPRGLRVLPPVVAGGREWRVKYHRETIDGVVTTAENRTGVIQTWVNSSVVCGSALPALKPVRQMGVIPFAINPTPKGILVIGYGLGVATALFVELSDRPVDCVEIAPAVVEASHEFARWNNRVYASPLLNLMPGDGRNYLLCTERTYDVISCDPTHPALGSGALYTAEFYELCQRRLKPGGVMTQYLPLHKLEPEDFRALVNTFRSAFPECMLLRGIAHGILVGRKDRPLAIDYGWLSGLFDRMGPASAAALSEVFIDGPADLVGGIILNRDGLVELTRGAGIVTDDNPGMEYAGARAGDTRTWRANAEALLECYTGPSDILFGFGPDSALVDVRLRRIAGAEQAKFRATVAAVSGRRDEQVKQFRLAMLLNPSDREAQLFLRMSGGR